MESDIIQQDLTVFFRLLNIFTLVISINLSLVNSYIFDFSKILTFVLSLQSFTYILVLIYLKSLIFF